MSTVADVVECMQRFAPLNLAEEWDNVGLLVGDRRWPVERIMTCLTVTPDVVAEALQERVGMIVTHHPLPFHALKKITSDTTVGTLLLELIIGKIAVYSPHTAFDSARTGINHHLAIGLGLQEIAPLVPADPSDPEIGSGRFGSLGEEVPLVEMAQRLKSFLDLEQVRIVGGDRQVVTRVAIACGSGGTFLEAAHARECDCLITGETSFHTCLEAESLGMALILSGHFSSERFALLSLADYLGDLLSDVVVWASRREKDPLRTV